MKAKDVLFIFLTVVLIALFMAEIFSNLPVSDPGKPAGIRPQQDSASNVQVEDITGILTRLEEAGLKPVEAKYYKVIR